MDRRCEGGSRAAVLSSCNCLAHGSQQGLLASTLSPLHPPWERYPGCLGWVFKVLVHCGQGTEGWGGVSIQPLFSFYRHSLMLHLIIPRTVQDEGSFPHWEDQRMKACAECSEHESLTLGPALPDWLLPPPAESLLSICLSSIPGGTNQ